MGDALMQQVRRGGSRTAPTARRALARLLTQVENSEAAAQAAVRALHADSGRAHLVGITGPPGSGKSTLVNELAKALRQRQSPPRVAIVAVDPSSPFTGGALLGDRVRMRDLSGDEGIFMRSMASRGNLGGLARATAVVLKVLDAAGYDIILVETVGAGQAEVDIARAAHTTVVVEAPGMGDDIQSSKAGILETADVLVVNKADRPGSRQTVAALRAMLHLGAPGSTRHHGRMMAATTDRRPPTAPDTWAVPIIETVAVEGKGIEAVLQAVDNHRAYLRRSGEWESREQARAQQEIENLLQARLMAQLRTAVPPAERNSLAAAVARREMDPYTAAGRLYEYILPVNDEG